MARLEVQGIVSAKDGLPWVQFRQVDDEGDTLARWQMTPQEAREAAQRITEASFNAVYDAALITWSKKADPENGEIMGARMVDLIRRHRADIWGLPDQPKDWRTDDERGEEERTDDNE